MIVKICGITREADLDICAEAGVDWVGINFWPGSKRYVSQGRGFALARHARRLGLVPIGLLVEPDLVQMQTLWRSGLFDYLQIYAPVAAVPGGIRWLRPVAVAADAGTIAIPEKRTETHLLLEAKVVGYGGAGQAFDWQRLRGLSRIETMMIGGGIAPDNVGKLLSVVRPFGIDTASGVESEPGIKDAGKIKALIDAARG